MLNNIYQFCSSRQLRIPFMGLVLALGLVGEQTKPVLSNQIEDLPKSQVQITNYQNSLDISLLSRLREVQEHRSQIQTTSEPSYSKTLPKNSKKVAQTTAMVTGSQKSATQSRTAPITNLPKQDGVYLYGQSPTPNQIGQGYLVFEKRQGVVKGALYMPSSEFSCFEGTLDRSGELAMTVNGSPGEASSNQIATANNIPSVNEDEPTSYAYSVALQDYHQLNSMTANDRRILQMCNQSSATGYRKLVK
ncbi:MAG: hypothetical protein KME32_29005 [Mojavia pulchra JT2-VF2]|uniref:Uncharacterized protein n=1 Tax=Mojavia pulchra JT2-VF2 TaxID=287848 RepID=A0A951Q5E3_9NOST|nr:hypothetical protein [Mojavia pulchra JT2-VF2]